MATWPFLSVLTFLPLLGALAILLFVRGDEEKQKRVAIIAGLSISLVVFALSLLLFAYFDPTQAGFQLIEDHPWLPDLGISYKRGIDGLSFWFVLASTFLTPICVLSVAGSVKVRVKEFIVALLVLETMMVGMFTAMDFVLFYLFFEGVLIPMFLIVGVWGGPNRIYAAYKFFLYTFLGSVLMLLAIIAIYLHGGTTDMAAIMKAGIPAALQGWLWLAFFASFAVKSPMWPFHTWLPYAHVEAPTAGSVILAGVLLKMGGYGLLRVNIQMLPLASEHFQHLVFALSIIAILYTSLIALVQSDMKKLIAYSSVAHMGYVTLGAFTLTQEGVEGSVIVMISHTVVSAALFLCVGVIYDRLHTRELGRYGGLADTMPRYALLFMAFMLASVALPGTSGFVGEFLTMQGTYLVSTWSAALAAVGMVLGAAYMLRLYRGVFYGPLDKPDLLKLPDLNRWEWAMFVPLLVVVLWIGIQPNAFRRYITPTMTQIVENYHAAVALPHDEVQP